MEDPAWCLLAAKTVYGFKKKKKKPIDGVGTDVEWADMDVEFSSRERVMTAGCGMLVMKMRLVPVRSG